MRLSTLLRAGAVVTASALTLGLSTVPASAHESTLGRPASAAAVDHPGARLATSSDLHVRASARASRSASSTAADVVQLKASSAVLFNPEENYIDVDVYLVDPEEQVDGITLDLSIGGHTVGPLDLYYDEDEDVTFVVVPGNVGLGKAQFTGTTIQYTEESGLPDDQDTTASNAFFVRRAIVSATPAATYSVKGKRKRFYVHQVGIYTPSVGDFTSLRTIKLQYNKNGTWRTKKNIKLNSSGNGSYSFKSSKKYRYRIYSGTTATSTGFRTSQSKKL